MVPPLHNTFVNVAVAVKGFGCAIEVLVVASKSITQPLLSLILTSYVPEVNPVNNPVVFVQVVPPLIE